MVALVYNPNDMDSGDGRISPGKKVSETLSEKQAGMVVNTCNLSYVGDRGRRITVQDETLPEK
jgi:hypothetical protein